MSGINGFSGDMFEDITRGNTYPFTFTFAESDETPIDITNWGVYVAFTTTLNSEDPELEVQIPVTDGEAGIASGFVEDGDTMQLPAGTVYASAFYIDDNGRTFVVDMAKIKVKENTTKRIDQS